MWIEIFKTGTHTSSNGNDHDFSVEDLDKIANQYNQLNSNNNNLAPLVKGHPSTDAPAYGWVERLARRGNYLMAKIRDLTPEIIEEVRNKKYQRISISLTPKLHLNHVGLLGAAVPAVDGLAPVSFVELDDNIELEYSQNDGSFTYLIHQNNELKEKVENYERALVSKDLMEFTSNLVEKKIISKHQKHNAQDLLELAYDIDKANPNEFNLLEKVKSFFQKMQFNSLQKEFATNQTTNKIGELLNTRELLNDRGELHRTILEYIEQNPEISYEQALSEIIK